jgi:TRAP-type uncharacterized transport system fused permease subunit
MLKRTLTLALVALLLLTTSIVTNTPAVSSKERDAALAQRIKADVMGLGRLAHVRVKFKDDTTLEGEISEIAADYFVITESKSHAPTTIAYQQVKQVKRNNLSTGAKVGIGVAVAVTVGIIIGVVSGRSHEQTGNPSPCTGSAQVGVPCPPGCICIAQ